MAADLGVGKPFAKGLCWAYVERRYGAMSGYVDHCRNHARKDMLTCKKAFASRGQRAACESKSRNGAVAAPSSWVGSPRSEEDSPTGERT